MMVTAGYHSAGDFHLLPTVRIECNLLKNDVFPTMRPIISVHYYSTTGASRDNVTSVSNTNVSGTEVSPVSLAKSLASLTEECSFSVERKDQTNVSGPEVAPVSLAKSLASLTEEFSFSVGRKDQTNVSGPEVSPVSLAKSLASLTEECSIPVERKNQTLVELKRLIEKRIKKRVKEQYLDGKFYDLIAKVIAEPKTLEDAYNSIKLNSNIQSTSNDSDICFASIAEQLASGVFDVQANTYRISRRTANQEYLVLPNLELKIVLEAIRMVVEVVYRRHFHKISHGYRSGRGQRSALRYICKEIRDPDWCFMLFTKKKVDSCILQKIISSMKEKINDDLLFCMLCSMFEAQVLNLEFGGYPKGQGLPQEGALSPLLMNIYLDLFDQEFFKMCLKYECLDVNPNNIRVNQHSKLREWFRRQLRHGKVVAGEETLPRIHACRYMDEIVVCIHGSREIAFCMKDEILSYLKGSLHLDVDATEVFSNSDTWKLQFLGLIVQNCTSEGSSLHAVHKLKDKVHLYASQKQVHWDDWTCRIGKKWLGHSLRQIKESKVGQGNNSSMLMGKISQFWKPGMKTDHWFKYLLKVWIQDLSPKAEINEEEVLSKYIVEPAIPEELIISFYNFQRKAEEYISSETSAICSLLPTTADTKNRRLTSFAPVDVIAKSLLRYGIVNKAGFPQGVRALVLQDDHQIVTWFAGLVRRWHRWFSDSRNFGDIMNIVGDCIRKSCVRTLAVKHRIIETEIEKRFEAELSNIPSAQELESGDVNMLKEFQFEEDEEAVMYGSANSGLCLLSLATVGTRSSSSICHVACCSAIGSGLYTLHVKEQGKHPGWRTGFATAIHPALNGKRISLCRQHLRDLYLGYISLQTVDFGALRR
ncbi:hypothetical protein EJ110_NYTH23239 [Nymphaea thermarum]|nr:hypothetical protein EJ110_NYTH23239 [Nymphaea thermarum]